MKISGHCYVSVLILFFLAGRAQQFAGIYTTCYWTSEMVEKEMDHDINIGKKNGSIGSSTKTLSGDTLVYIVNHKVDPFTAKYTFKLVGYERPYCDYEEYSFHTASGSQIHLQELIHLYKFRQRSENLYLSKFKYKTEMRVHRKSDNDSCYVVCFRYLDLTKKEHKKIYKPLRKRVGA